MDVHALLRRIRAGESDRQIASVMQLDRATVAKYRAWAHAQQLLSGELPELGVLHQLLATTLAARSLPPQNQSSIEPYRQEVEQLQAQGLKPRLIFQRLLQQHPDFPASESAVRRFCRSLRAALPPEVVARLETPAGEVAQVDFGDVGLLLDPQSNQLRRAYVFVMVLAWSRHMYAEFVFDQKVPTWLLCHRHAFEFFQAVPKRIVLDNLKAAVIQAYAVDRDVEVQRAYAECAEHYGFLIDPCWPAKPQHKGKVERGGVSYIQQSLVPLLLPNTPLPEANRQLRHWLLTTAGEREHGTTHEPPLRRFLQVEQALLQPLPPTPYEPALWKQVKLHRDGHVVFEKAFYSAPSRLVGQSLWLRAGLREIRLFSAAFELVATHSRAMQPGQRFTQPDHLPTQKLRGLAVSRAECQAQAETVGPATARLVRELLASRPVDKLRTALRVLRLAETYTPARLEAACARALAFEELSLVALKHILAEQLDQLSLPNLQRPASPTVFTFARPAHELAQALGGGEAWN